MTRSQYLTLVAAILGSALVAVDSSVVSVALPALERDPGGGLAAQQWISNAYLLALGSLILIGGSLGDIYGERRIFTIGVAAFGVLSFACALAPTTGALIAARAVQRCSGGADHAVVAGDHRRGVHTEGTRRCDRGVDRVGCAFVVVRS